MEIIGTTSQDEITITTGIRVDQGSMAPDSMAIVTIAISTIAISITEKPVTPTINLKADTTSRIRILTAAPLIREMIQVTTSKVRTVIKFQLM